MSIDVRGSLAAVAVVAACTGPHYDPRPFEADPPEVYVAKVKNILVGLAPSDAEIAAVTADPDALPGLIDGWMKQPEYARKMMVFFKLSFQQAQISVADFVDVTPPRGLGSIGNKTLPALVQDANESIARTALAADAAGKPITEAFGAQTIMMTPALMALYAYLDARQVDDNGKVADSFATANPGAVITLESSAGPVDLSHAITPGDPLYLHFYNPDVTTEVYPATACNGVDPITFPATAESLWNVMFGQLPAHKLADGTACPIRAGSGKGLQLAQTDYTAWKPVTIRAPGSGETTTEFYDLLAQRGASELVLHTPRVGFFSTPAFFANWPTNTSNQMRVTVNQALIVATGHAIDGTDSTQPPSTPGLDPSHAMPDTACYGCHQLLDPTRSVLSANWSWFYNQQTDSALQAQPGLFAFEGQIMPVKTLGDFAAALAQHSLVPAAWAQKLCYYVNSAPCDPNDPVFQAIVADFQGSGLQWSTLVRELLSSPITTNAAPTATHTTNGEVIAVARRDHLCAQINNRLGFVDACQLDETRVGMKSAIALIVSGLPSDGYGRGATIPVLPNQPSLFYSGGVENICERLSLVVVDPGATAMVPGTKQWSSSQPDAAISDFVAIVMGLTSADPRTAPVRALLSSHFAAAQTTGATPTDALRSTFMVACESPSFIGIGM